MVQSNPTVPRGSHPRPKVWREITQRALELFVANVTVIASPPFLRNEKWSIICGDARRYRIHEYPDARAAWREFRAIENAVLRDFGFPSCDFHLLDSEVAATIVDLELYRTTVARAVDGLR